VRTDTLEVFAWLASHFATGDAAPGLDHPIRRGMWSNPRLGNERGLVERGARRCKVAVYIFICVQTYPKSGQRRAQFGSGGAVGAG
jgi:hypothetical protein